MDDPLEKPKRKMSEKQLENLAKAREAKKNSDKTRSESKQQEKLERRFEKLVDLFSAVQMPVPETQEVIKKRKTKHPVPPELSSESDEEPVVKPKAKARVEISPSKQVLIRFA